jgi:hypothetical protein
VEQSAISESRSHTIDDVYLQQCISDTRMRVKQKDVISSPNREERSSDEEDD